MIKRIQIENFKSFGKVDLEPHPRVNLLIGPNSSGKSNFLEAITYLETNGDRLLKNPKANRKQKKSEWRVRIEFNLFRVESFRSWMDPDDNSKTLLEYYDAMESGRKIEYGTKGSIPDISFITTSAENSMAEESGIQPEPDIFLERYVHSIKQEIREYKLSQESISKPFLLRENTKYLESDFSNISGFVYSLIQEDDEAYKSLCSDLFKMTNEFDLLKSPISKVGNGNIELAIRDSIEKKNYLVKEVSEGISYFIAILCLLHQPDPPKVILLEEIENGIHPRRLADIIGLIWKLAEEKDVQFFITTHSPIILDQFADSPESVLIFDKEEGISKVKKLSELLTEKAEFAKNHNLPQLDYTAELSENWLWGLLNGVPHVTSA